MKKTIFGRNRGRFTILTAVMMMGAIPAHAGYFTTITIDGDYSDWAGVPVLDDDPADNPGSVDLALTQIANDASYLYIRNTFHTPQSLGTFIALDADNNVATGFDIFGLGLLGSEAGWQNDFPFTEATGVFNDGQGMSGDFFGSGAALLDQFANSDSRELAISLDILFNQDGSPVFAGDTVTLLMWTDLGAADVSAPIRYTLAQVPEPGSITLLGLGFLGLALRRHRK